MDAPSIVIPAHNAQNTVGPCVEALRSQSLEPSQIVVVDDASTDDTAAVAREAGAEVLTLAVRGGPAAARNRGIEQTRGYIVVFTDADCIPGPDWLSTMVEPFSDPGVIATKGAYRSEQRSLTARFVQLEYEERYRRTASWDSIDFVDTYAAAFRRSLLWEAGGFDESLEVCEDQELSFRYSRLDGRMVFVPKAVVQHHHADNPVWYFRKKLKIARFKVRVLARHPDKAVRDSHTPQSLKVQILSIFGLLATLPLGFVWAPAFVASLACLAIFLLSAVPAVLRAAVRDRRVGYAACGLIILRALALGIGMARGALECLVNPGLRVGERASWLESRCDPRSTGDGDFDREGSGQEEVSPLHESVS